LNQALLELARKKVPSVPLLVNFVSKRVVQLNAGFRPLVKPQGREEENVDLALREIAEGKLTVEIEFLPKEEPAAQT